MLKKPQVDLMVNDFFEVAQCRKTQMRDPLVSFSLGSMKKSGQRENRTQDVILAKRAPNHEAKWKDFKVIKRKWTIQMHFVVWRKKLSQVQFVFSQIR